VDHGDGQERALGGQLGCGDLADVPKQKEHKFNLHLTSFEAKEGETEKELVQWLNTELLQGQMKLRVKVVIAMRSGLQLRGLLPRQQARALAWCYSNSQQAKTIRPCYKGVKAWWGPS